MRGIVVPYVGGQKVKVSFYREGRKVEVKTVSVLAIGNGAGQFHIGYASGSAGMVQARAVHYATPEQAAFAGRSEQVHVASPDLSPGARGPSVRLLQSELNALHFVVPLNGVFDEATGRAVIAFRKMTGLARVPYTNQSVFKRLQEGGGVFHVRYPGDGRHVEGDLTKQVLAEIEPGGHVRALYTMSSGKPSTPTVIGRFRVYSKTPGHQLRGHGRLQLLHPRLCDPRLRRSADLRRQPRLPARADPQRRRDLRLGAAGDAGGRVQRGRRRQPPRQRQRRAPSPGGPVGPARQTLTRITRARKASPKP